MAAGNASPFNGLQRESHCSRLTMSQPHVDFINTVRAISFDKIAAIWEMGFGTLQSIGCPQLYDQILKAMVDGLEPLNGKVVIRGRSYDIHASDYERLLGVRDGGIDMDFSGDSNIILLARSVKQELAGVDGTITLSSLKEVVLRRAGVDRVFRVGYVLYAMSTLLCPADSEVVDSTLLVPLNKCKAIGDLNWATYCFGKLLDVVLTRSHNDYAISGACLLFLQLFYLDAVGTSLGWVDKTITPIIFWGADKVANLIYWITEHDKEWAEKNAETHEDDVKVVETMTSEQVKEALAEMASVKNEMNSLKSVVGTTQEIVVGLADNISTARTEREEIVAIVVAEVFKQCKPHLIDMHGAPTRGTKRAVTERSNSVQFNGEKEIESKGGNSDEPSCMILYCNNVNGQKVTHDQIKVNTKPIKASQATLSDCSVSPAENPKTKRWTSTYKAPKVSAVVPEARRQLQFKKSGTPRNLKTPTKRKRKNANSGDVPFRAIGDLSKEDMKLLKFIYMHIEDNDLDYCAIVAAGDGTSVTRTAIRCLGPGKYVCDQVIDLFVGYLNGIGNANGDWYVPVYFAKCSIRKRGDGSDEEWIERCKRFSRLDRFIDNFANCKRIFIPMHEPLPTNEQEGHWYLLKVDVLDRSAEIIDSAPDPSKTISRQRDTRAVLTMLDRMYGDRMFRESNKLFSFAVLPLKTNVNAPRQKNGFDCGLFVIRSMQGYGTNWAAKYNSDNERARLMVECMRHLKNEVTDLHVRVDRCLSRITGK